MSLIFDTVDELVEFRENFNKGKFRHERRHGRDPDRYNYIIRPKATGYRGIHDIYEYNTTSLLGARYKGLYVELQYRTAVQHAWATAVEVVSRITENQPKFQRGDERHILFFRLASEIIARTAEGMRSCFPERESLDLAEELQIVDTQISLMRLLRSLQIIDQGARNSQNLILRFSPGDELTMYESANIATATDLYFSLEKNNPGDDIVLVRAETFGEIRSAYRNYFQDTEDFVRYVDNGISNIFQSDSKTNSPNDNVR